MHSELFVSYHMKNKMHPFADRNLNQNLVEDKCALLQLKYITTGVKIEETHTVFKELQEQDVPFLLLNDIFKLTC